MFLKDLRNDATAAVDGVLSGAGALNRTADSISKLTVLVATVAIAALGVAVVALLYATNREVGQ